MRAAPPTTITAIGVWAAMVLPVVLLCADFVARETPAYAWDWGDYFASYQQFGSLITDGGPWLGALIRSVRQDDYNVASLVALYPFHWFFAGSRTGYVTGVALLYLVPAGFIAAKLGLAAAERDGETVGWTTFLAAAIVCVAFPHFWLPTLRGLPDIVGLIPLGLATLLVLRSDFLTRDPVRHGLKIGLLIWAAFLFRRWYAYAGVGLIVATLLIGAGRIWLSGPGRQERLARFLEGGKAAVLAILVALVLFQSELMARILRTSYADVYAAYQMSLGDQIGLHYDRTGALYAAAIACGLLLAVARRNLAIGFMALAALITFALFAATQGPGVQHGLPMVFWLLPAAVYALHGALAAMRRAARLPSALAAVLLAAAVLAGHIHPQARAAMGPFAVLMPRATAFPLQLEQKAAYQELISTVRALPEQARVAVFASSAALSGSLLAALAPDLQGRLVEPGDVDMRDGFRIAALEASHAVVADPVQLHLPASGQRMVSLPVGRILRREGFGAAYAPVAGPFRLDNGAVAYLYQRLRPFEASDLDALRADIQAIYPQWRHVGGHIGPPGLISDPRS